MSRTYHHGDRQIRVRGVRKDPVDLRRLARALIALAQAQAEADAEAASTSKTPVAKNVTKINDNVGVLVVNDDTTDDGDAA